MTRPLWSVVVFYWLVRKAARNAVSFNKQCERLELGSSTNFNTTVIVMKGIYQMNESFNAVVLIIYVSVRASGHLCMLPTINHNRTCDHNIMCMCSNNNIALLHLVATTICDLIWVFKYWVCVVSHGRIQVWKSLGNSLLNQWYYKNFTLVDSVINWLCMCAVPESSSTGQN